MISRRGFLGGMAGILAASAAPAIVREVMPIKAPKIWVPVSVPVSLRLGERIIPSDEEQRIFCDLVDDRIDALRYAFSAAPGLLLFSGPRPKGLEAPRGRLLAEIALPGPIRQAGLIGVDLGKP